MPIDIVKKKPCNQCLFSKNKIVSEERKEQLINECLRDNSNFECHKATLAGEKATCHGFYKSHTNQELNIILEHLGEVVFVD